MLTVYINYPNAQATIHRNSRCGSIRPHNRPNQRICRINLATISEELKKFTELKESKDDQYAFRSEAGWNDIWLELDFQDGEFEEAVLGFILRQIGHRYWRLADIQPKEHC